MAETHGIKSFGAIIMFDLPETPIEPCRYGRVCRLSWHRSHRCYIHSECLVGVPILDIR